MPAWESAPLISEGQKKNAWESAPLISQAASAQSLPQPDAASTPKDERSLLSRYVDIHPGVAAAETGLNLVSGMVATPLSGLAGIGTAGAKAFGLTNKEPGDVVREVGDTLTYEPRTKGGKTLQDVVTKPFQWLGQGADKVGSYAAEKTGSPAVGAAVNTGIQALPMLAGRVLGGRAANSLATKTAELEKQKIINAPKDEALRNAREKGYVFPPPEAEAGVLASFFQGVVGDINMEKGASTKNQRVTNGLIKKEIGIAEDDAITIEALEGVRNKASEAYKTVKKVLPELSVTSEFKFALENPESKFAAARKEFPEYFKDPEIEKLIKNLSKDKFSSQAAIEMQKKLRYDGNANMKAFDKPSQQALGEAQWNAAKAIDDLIDQNLNAMAPPGVKNFQSKLTDGLREARRKIAQTYAVQGALNETTGNVSAKSLAKLWEKGQPLSGGLKDVAQTAQAFGKSMRDMDKEGSRSNISNLDVAKATLLGATGHGGVGALSAFARPLVKPIMLSDWYQARNVNPPTYQPGWATQWPSDVLNSPAYPYFAIPKPPLQNNQ